MYRQLIVESWLHIQHILVHVLFIAKHSFFLRTVILQFWFLRKKEQEIEATQLTVIWPSKELVGLNVLMNFL